MAQNNRKASLQTHCIIIMIMLSIAISFTGHPGTCQRVQQEIKRANVPGIPVLCYHNITWKRYKPGILWIGRQSFENHLKMLHDSGYHSILPAQLYDHVTRGTALPPKPFIITFDDAHETHYSIAKPLLEDYGFRGVFFIITVTMDKKNYLSTAQVKDLSDQGHVIACHTYDHPFVTKLEGNGWHRQIAEPGRKLATITGRPVEYFAYPFGSWNPVVIEQLKKYGYKAAFQLTGKTSAADPLFTVRRMMVDGNLSGKGLHHKMELVFRH